jgi:hypothetical protein
MNYSLHKAGTQEFYELSVGDYFMNGFVYFRQSRWPHGRWALDT